MHHLVQVFVQVPVLVLVLVAGTATAQSEREIVAIPSNGNFILHERSFEMNRTATVSVQSDVPVTAHRYSDSSFTEGQQPVLYNTAKVTITSDCATYETSSIPSIDWTDGLLTVDLGVSPDDGSAMGFLPSGSYSAVWSWINYFCQNFPGLFSTTPNAVVLPEDPSGNATDEAPADGLPTLPAESSTAFLGTMWLPGEVLEDYSDCGFDCCTSRDCVDLTDVAGAVLGGCCQEGKCRVKFFAGEECFDVGPPADVACGYDAWLNFQADGNCPSSGAVGATTTEPAVATKPVGDATTPAVATNPVRTTISPLVSEPTADATTTTAMTTAMTIPMTTTATSSTTTTTFTTTISTTSPQSTTTAASLASASYKCAAEFCEGNLNDEYLLKYRVNPAEGTITMELVYDGVAWVAFALATSGQMVGGEAIIGIPGDITPVQKYELSGKTIDAVTPMPEDRQTLIDPTVQIVDGQTILRFTKLIQEDGEIEISPQGNFFLWAYGTGTSLGYHASRGAFTSNLLEEEVVLDSVATATSSSTSTTTSTSSTSSTGEETTTTSSSSTTTTTSTTPVTTTPAATTVPPQTTEATTTSSATTSVSESTPAATASPPMTTESTTSNATTTDASIIMDSTTSSTTTSTTTDSSTTNATVLATGVSSTESATSTTGATDDTTAATSSSTEANADVPTPAPTGVTDPPSVLANVTDKPTFRFDANLTGGVQADSSTRPPTNKPTFWWEAESGERNIENAAFHVGTPSFLSLRRTMTALLALVLVSYIFPGRAGPLNENGATISLWGWTKFAVAALAVSSAIQKSADGNIRKNGRNLQRPLAANPRQLQTCTYNVEILFDGCTNAVEISAPSARTIDVVLENLTSQENPDDECQSDYSADLVFPDDIALELAGDVADDGSPVMIGVAASPDQCIRPMDGRPFVDASGSSLTALPMISSSVGSVSWSGEVVSSDACDGTATTKSRNGNATSTMRHHHLGQDWIQRALGEHSSVASFSAFSIALMTNNAPSDLVEDALVAGMDEIRHARVSFDIASNLVGKEVGPGPLPSSKHEFGRDLVALAVAVAKEGCVDETLSTYAAAVEVAEIEDVLENKKKHSKYSNVDRETLSWIRKELQVIAMDESNHSALAWRTLLWVCQMDADACDAVQESVFDDDNLDLAVQRRFGGVFGTEWKMSEIVRGEWNKIYEGFKRLNIEASGAYEKGGLCIDGEMDHRPNGNLVLSLTENILRGVLCV
mmetsp:Transcript_6090/g.12216  ORF Transcript_6090/g.12216 Transcript_6090/m.12216 type:complete len:1238 (+) Transcript_6090:226-3939(+)